RTRERERRGTGQLVDQFGDRLQHPVLVGDRRDGRRLPGAGRVDVHPAPTRALLEDRLVDVTTLTGVAAPAGQEEDRPAVAEGLVVHAPTLASTMSAHRGFLLAAES